MRRELADAQKQLANLKRQLTSQRANATNGKQPAEPAHQRELVRPGENAGIVVKRDTLGGSALKRTLEAPRSVLLSGPNKQLLPWPPKLETKLASS